MAATKRQSKDENSIARTGRRIGKARQQNVQSELAGLHAELVKLQLWTVHKGLKVCVVFEGETAPAKAA